MADIVDPLTSLLIIISISGAMAMILRRVGFSTVVGYILGGILGSLIGAPVEVSPLIAQLGLILLGFEIGAEIGGRKALGSFRQALIIEIISMSLIYILTGLVSAILRLGFIGHILLFLIAINTSTGILYKVIHGRVGEDVRSLLLASSVIEDTVAISGLAVFIAVKDIANPIDLILSIGKVGFLAVIAFLIGVYAFKMLGRRLSDLEMLPIIAISAALAYYVTFGIIGVSQLLGTFIAGFALARAVDLGRAITQLGGLRELGLLLYFSSLGGVIPQLEGGELLITPALIALVMIVVIIKFVAFSTALWMLGLERHESIKAALYMTSISELGIIISSQAYESKLIGSSYVMLATYVVLISAIISSIAVKFENTVVMGIYYLIPNKVEEIARQYLSRVRYVLAVRAHGLMVFLYGFIFMVFIAVATDIAISLLRYLPEFLLQYGLILSVIISTAFIFSIPYFTWKSYKDKLDKDPPAKAYVEKIIGINISMLLVIFGIFLEAYIVNRIVLEHQVDIGGIQGHIIFIVISILIILYILRNIYYSISRIYIRG
ncbi:MAG: cation:proton antiporter [Desulfurococcales archaeon]|jgi:Kef-type K+ transport system membrane component KefB|nr:cation:proton antiporter [Desulfurococcales archaeon]